MVQYYLGIQRTGDLKVMTGSGYDCPESFIFLLYMPKMDSALKSYFCQVTYGMVFVTLKSIWFSQSLIMFPVAPI